MKKLLMIFTVCLIVAAVSCRKDQPLKPVVKAAPAEQAIKPAQSVKQVTYDYHQAMMAKHTVVK